MPGFHDTIDLNAQEKKFEDLSVSHQEDKVLAFFKAQGWKSFTPTEVWEILNLEGVPLTSIRRSISNLTEEGALVKTTEKRAGKYGKPNYTWKLNSEMFKNKQEGLFDNV